MIRKVIILLLFSVGFLYCQGQNVLIGPALPQNSKAAIFDLSDAKAVNIKVSVWGAVRNPGFYIVPDYTQVTTLLSYAGGPIENSQMENLRIYREDSKTGEKKIISFNYDDLLWGKDLKNMTSPPSLQPGDILLVPIEPKFFLRDYISFGLSSLAVLFSVLTLIIQLRRS